MRFNLRQLLASPAAKELQALVPILFTLYKLANSMNKALRSEDISPKIAMLCYLSTLASSIYAYAQRKMGVNSSQLNKFLTGFSVLARALITMRESYKFFSQSHASPNSLALSYTPAESPGSPGVSPPQSRSSSVTSLSP